MSYCRTSDRGSDLYVWCDGSIYYVDVARNRGGLGKPLIPIGLKHDGESFAMANVLALRDHLGYLKTVGYKIPKSVFRRIDEEIVQGLTLRDCARALNTAEYLVKDSPDTYDPGSLSNAQIALNEAIKAVGD